MLSLVFLVKDNSCYAPGPLPFRCLIRAFFVFPKKVKNFLRCILEGKNILSCRLVDQNMRLEILWSMVRKIIMRRSDVRRGESQLPSTRLCRVCGENKISAPGNTWREQNFRPVWPTLISNIFSQVLMSPRLRI